MNNTPSRFFRTEPGVPSRRWVVCALWGLAAVASVQAAPPAVPMAQRPLVKLDSAWIRPSVKGQNATGGYMVLTARLDTLLVGAFSPAAGVTELHTMSMEGGVMRMRAVPRIVLAAGRPVALQAGNGQQHLMLMDLKKPLVVGDKVEVTFKLQLSTGENKTQTVTIPVLASAPPPAPEAPRSGQRGPGGMGPGPGFGPGPGHAPMGGAPYQPR